MFFKTFKGLIPLKPLLSKYSRAIMDYAKEYGYSGDGKVCVF